MQKTNSKRNTTIDVIKGLLILFVIFGHINIDVSVRRLLLAPFWENSAVPMFLLISGFLYSKSFIKNDIDTFTKAYNIKNIAKKVLRFLIPFSIFFIFEILLYFVVNNNEFQSFINNNLSIHFSIDNYIPHITNIIWMYIKGGEGPGSYYIPLMIEFILVFPLLYFLIKKHKEKGMIACAIITIIYNLLTKYINLYFYASISNLLCSLFVIAIGIYASMYNIDYKNKLIYIGMIVGIIYIVLVKYLDYSPFIFHNLPSRALPACLLWWPIVVYVIQNLKLNNKFLAKIGSISFDVLLVQKVFFLFMNIVVYYFIDNAILQIIIIYLIIIIVSIVFNKFEIKITNSIIKKIS